MSKLQEKFLPLIEKHHARCYKTTKEKIYKRILAARTRWKKSYGIPKKATGNRLIEAFGTKDPYSGEIIDGKNFSLDHILPRRRGGSENDPDNLEIITTRENKRKGTMTKKEYLKLRNFIKNNFPEVVEKYILMSLSSRQYF